MIPQQKIWYFSIKTHEIKEIDHGKASRYKLYEIQGFEKVEFNEEDIDIFPVDIESKKAEINEPVKDNHVLHW